MKKPLVVPRDKSAALYIDLQEEHRQDPRYLVEGFESILANARKLQQAARRNGIPNVHFAYVVDMAQARPFHPVMEDGRSAFSDKDDPLTAICAEVAPQGDELLIVKSEASAFGTGLGDELTARGIAWLFIAGVWTEACVDATVKAAAVRGFHVLLVKDACGSGTAAMHQTGILNLANRLYGGAVVTTDAACRLMAGEAVEGWRVEGSVPIRYEAETIEALYEAL